MIWYIYITSPVGTMHLKGLGSTRTLCGRMPTAEWVTGESTPYGTASTCLRCGDCIR